MLNFPLQNISNSGKDIYLFNRQLDGKLTIMKDVTFFPYFYQESLSGIYRTINGKKVNKINCREPSEVARKRDGNSYEADILYPKRYLIDKVGEILKSPIKYLFIDIEIQTKSGIPDFNYPDCIITCITIYNSLSKEIKTFYLRDYIVPETGDDKLDYEEAEKALLDFFVKWIKEQQPDLLLGWNFVNFDYPYLAKRITKILGIDFAESISPIQRKRIGNRDTEIWYPAGISVLDYLDLFKKIYNRELSYSLDNIAQKYLKTEPNKKVDFSKITEDIKEKNINDVKKMVALEELKHVISYYDEIRRMGKCLWEDITWNSKVLDVMLLTEAKKMGVILPSKKYAEDIIIEEGSEFEGAYRRADCGRFENIYKLDLSSAYPMAIINFCLDIANLTENKNEQKITITDRETNVAKYDIFVRQNSNALLPTIARKLIIKKDTLKKQLKSLDPENPEAKDLQIKYDAVKGLVNSLFGVCALRVFRLYNVNVASAITSLVRDLLHYVEDKLQEQGMAVTYLDTDSIFVTAKEDPTNLLNGLVNQWAKEKYNKDNIGIEFECEGIFESLLVVALCHYKGRLRTKSGLKIEEKGIECLDPESIIPYSKGYRHLKDIKIGNKIYDSSGRLTKVIDKQYSLHSKYLKIKVKGKFSLKCSLNHKIFIMRNNQQYLLLAKEIKIGDYLLEPIQIIKNNKNKFSENLALILGFFYSEGCIGKNNLLRFTFHKKEKEMINLIINAIKKEFNIKMSIYPSYNVSKAIVVQKQSKKFENLKKIIKINKNNSSYCSYHQLPSSLLLSSKDSISIFLKALFSGDGCITKKSIVYSTNSKELFEGIKFLLKRFGIIFSERIGKINLKFNKPNKSYIIDIGRCEFFKYYNLIGFFGEKEKKLQEFLLNKYDLNKNQYNHLFNGLLLKQITNIKIINKKIELIDITTESGEFLCDYLKVHNSKRKDSSIFIKEFQTKLIDKILDGESQEAIITFIKSETEAIKNRPLKDIAFPFKVSNKEYKAPPIFLRAIEYSKELNPNIEFISGEVYYYIYVPSFGEATRKSSRMLKNKETGKKELKSSETKVNKDVLAFSENDFAHIKEIDYPKMIDRNINDKVEHIFTALNWDFTKIKEVKVKKERRKIDRQKDKKEEER